MTSFTPEEIAAIIAREKPGYRVVSAEVARDEPTAPADAVGPDLATLRSKYAAPDATFVDVSAAAELTRQRTAAGDAATPFGGAARQDALVLIEADARRGQRRGPGPKAVLISGKTGHIIAEQG